MGNQHSLLSVIYSNQENLLEQVQDLLAHGANPNECTQYFESPLRVASSNGRFDVVKCLLQAGADPAHLKWTPLFHDIAYGALPELEQRLQAGDELECRDSCERTPILVAVQSGDIDKVKRLIAAGADLRALGRGGKSALEFAIQMDNTSMLEFLIAQGFDIEKYNQFGYTPLMLAADNGACRCLKSLLEHGADIYKKDRRQFSQKSAIAHAANVQAVEILVAAGDDLNQIDDEMRVRLLGLSGQQELSVSQTDYLEHKHRVFGNANPQTCDFAFWYDMVRCNNAAWSAREKFGDKTRNDQEAVWCYQRFGKSLTALGTGEYIEIAGEHEDYYDPDFCIYNEVFHHQGGGRFTIYQYPKTVFPPTDFHSATLVGNDIYIIGNLGYIEERKFGTTPVYCLNCNSFAIEKVATEGECPGWIYGHSADLKEDSIIRLQGGKILSLRDGKETREFNEHDFELDLRSMVWSKHAHKPKSKTAACLPESYKHFMHGQATLLAVEENSSWYILKIIAVDRFDIENGQSLYFEDEEFIATSDDFLFVVAYLMSPAYNDLEALESAVRQKDYRLKPSCIVSRTIHFPSSARYVGYDDILEEEKKVYSAWKENYTHKKARIK